MNTPTQKLFRIRTARTEDESHLRELLPEAGEEAVWSRRFVAEGRNGEVLGGAVLARGRLRCRAAIRVPVHPTAREVELALRDAVIGAARQRRQPTVFAWESFERGSPEIERWTALGFSRLWETFLYEADIPRTERFYRRYIGRIRVPAEARVVSLGDATIEDVARLRLRFLGGVPAGIRARLNGKAPAGNYSSDLSRVVLLQNEVTAIWLVERKPEDSAHLDSLVVDPRFRARWANPLLKYEGVRAALDAGIHTLTFEISADNQGVRKDGPRVGARVLRRTVAACYPLGSDKEFVTRESESASDEPVIVVSGLPHSGADVVARMIVAGGRFVAVEDFTGATGPEPLRELPLDPGFWDAAAGRVILVAPHLIPRLPAGLRYRVILVRREPQELVRRQREELLRRNLSGADLTDEALAKLFHRQLERIEAFLRNKADLEVVIFEGADVETDALAFARRLADFLGGGGVPAMARVAT